MPYFGAARSEFIVVGPLAIQSAGLGCAPSAHATLSLVWSGRTYQRSPMIRATGSVPRRSEPTPFPNHPHPIWSQVQSGYTTIVLWVDYVPGPKGTLTVQRFDRAEGAEGTTIEIGAALRTIPVCPATSVSASPAEMRLLLGIHLGEDGATSVDVAAGRCLRGVRRFDTGIDRCARDGRGFST